MRGEEQTERKNSYIYNIYLLVMCLFNSIVSDFPFFHCIDRYKLTYRLNGFYDSTFTPHVKIFMSQYNRC